MFTTLPTILPTLLLLLLLPLVSAHGYLTSSTCLTRGQAAYGSPPPRTLPNYIASRGWPIGQRPDQWTLPQSEITALAPGLVKMVLSFNGGANHIGPCTVSLHDRATRAQLAVLATVRDCAKSLLPAGKSLPEGSLLAIPAVMDVEIPAEFEGRQGLVLKFELLAQHISVDNPEIYDDLCDISVSSSAKAFSVPPNAMTDLLFGWSPDQLAMLDSAALSNVGVLNPVAPGTGTVAATSPAAVTSASVIKNGAAVVMPSPTPAAPATTKQADSYAQADSGSSPAIPAAPVKVAAAPVVASQVPASVYESCGNEWNACNAAWLKAGASGPYSCQTDYQTCTSPSKYKRLHRRSVGKFRMHCKLFSLQDYSHVHNADNRTREMFPRLDHS